MNPERYPTRKGYDSDMTDAEWAIIGPLLTEDPDDDQGSPG